MDTTQKPYSKEWQAQMMRLPKKDLVELLGQVGAKLTAAGYPFIQPAAPVAAENPLVAFLLSSDTGASSKAIAARYAGVAPDYGSYSHPYDSSDFGRCYRLLQLAPAININIMRGASPVWDKMVEAWAELTQSYEQGDNTTFRAIIQPLWSSTPATTKGGADA